MCFYIDVMGSAPDGQVCGFSSVTAMETTSWRGAGREGLVPGKGGGCSCKYQPSFYFYVV